MPSQNFAFRALNIPPSSDLPQHKDSFTLTAFPNTNLWRRPGQADTSTAPILFTTLYRPFLVAEVTINADWDIEMDQGGLVIFAGQEPSVNSGIASTCKWVKAGIEFNDGMVNLSSVTATSEGADSSLTPLPIPTRGTTTTMLRIKLQRNNDSLSVWYQDPTNIPYDSSPQAVSNTWRKVREVTWFFHGVEDKNVHVGVYAGRPAARALNWENSYSPQLVSSQPDALVVQFEDFEILC